MTESQKKGATLRIGDRIQTRLNELGKNPAWLADKVGVSRSTITRILKGERNPTPETLHEIAPVIGVEIAQLVAGTDAAERVVAKVAPRARGESDERTSRETP